MTYTLYADMFFLENLIMNYIILSASSVITKKLFGNVSTPPKRLLGSIVGAIYALALVLVPTAQAKALGSVFGKIGLSVIIVCLSFFPKKIGLLLKELGVFCFTGLVFAGTAIGVTFIGVPFTITANGVAIADLPPGLLNIFLTVGIGYISIGLLINSLRKICDGVQESYVSLYIEFDGKGRWIPALIDTGNELRDPLTGTPVIIVESEALKGILCPELTENAFSENTLIESTGKLGPDWAKRFRIIPFSSLGCENGLLAGFKADNIKIKGNFEIPCNKTSAIVCLYNKELSENKKYSALLSPELVA